MGNIGYWGTSEWTGEQLREVHGLCEQRNLYRPQVEQPQYSLIARDKFETDVRPAGLEYGMGMVVWSPLGMGLLTGKYDGGMPPDSRMAHEEWLRGERYTEEILERVRKFKAYADALGCSRAQLALAWVAAQEGVSSVILGASRLEQLRENLGALVITMDAELNHKLGELFPATTQ
ncbi:MAG: aldo/keto reductase [Planctomycetota bacterium]